MRLSADCRQTCDTCGKLSSAKCRQESRVTTNAYKAADNLPTATNTLSPMLTTDWALSRRAPMCRQGPHQTYWPLKSILLKRPVAGSVNEVRTDAVSAPHALRSVLLGARIRVLALRKNCCPILLTTRRLPSARSSLAAAAAFPAVASLYERSGPAWLRISRSPSSEASPTRSLPGSRSRVAATTPHPGSTPFLRQRRTPWPSRVAFNRGLGAKPCR